MNNKKIDKRKKEVMKHLYLSGIGNKEIAERMGLKYKTVCGYTNAWRRGVESPYLVRKNSISNMGFRSHQDYYNYLSKKRGFDSYGGYRESLATKSGFKNKADYENSLAIKRGYNSSADYRKDQIKEKHGDRKGYKMYLARKKGFETIREYEDHLAKKQGFSNHIDRQNNLAREKGFKDNKAYILHLLKSRGFNSFREYKNSLKGRRGSDKKYSDLADFLRISFAALNINSSWVSDVTGINAESIRLYYNGLSFPRVAKMDAIREAIYNKATELGAYPALRQHLESLGLSGMLAFSDTRKHRVGTLEDLYYNLEIGNKEEEDRLTELLYGDQEEEDEFYE